MSRETALDSAAAVVARRQPLLTTDLTSSAPNKLRAGAKNGSCRRSRMGETTGECAAVCCCCPCAMVHLLILAVYRLPRGLWRKKKRRLLRKKNKISSEEKGNNRKPNAIGSNAGDEAEESTEDEGCGDKNDAVDWDNEMWARFYGAGFWRSASQRKDDDV